MDEKQNKNIAEQEVNEATPEQGQTGVSSEEMPDKGTVEGQEQVEQETLSSNEQQPAEEDLPLPEDELNKLRQELEREKARAEEYYNRLVRIQADFDNFRKRTLKEKEELWRYAAEPLVTSILPVLDNFQRALEAPLGDGEKFLEGVKMIYRQLEDVLASEGLKPVDARGKEFDPNIHEAVMQEETDEYPDNTVTEELRKGYFFKDKLIRPAMVKVARSS